MIMGVAEVPAAPPRDGFVENAWATVAVHWSSPAWADVPGGGDNFGKGTVAMVLSGTGRLTTGGLFFTLDDSPTHLAPLVATTGNDF